MILPASACSEPAHIDYTLRETVLYVENVLSHLSGYLRRLEALPFAVYLANPSGCPLQVQTELTLSFKRAASFFEPIAAYCEAVAEDLFCLLAATGDLKALSARLKRLRERYPYYACPFEVSDLHGFDERSDTCLSFPLSPTMQYVFVRPRSPRKETVGPREPFDEPGIVRPRPSEPRVSYTLHQFSGPPAVIRRDLRILERAPPKFLTSFVQGIPSWISCLVASLTKMSPSSVDRILLSGSRECLVRLMKALRRFSRGCDSLKDISTLLGWPARSADAEQSATDRTRWDLTTIEDIHGPFQDWALVGAQPPSYLHSRIVAAWGLIRERVSKARARVSSSGLFGHNTASFEPGSSADKAHPTTEAGKSSPPQLPLYETTATQSEA